MAVEQVLQLSAINVVIQPHPDGIYERLTRAAYRRRIVANVFGDRYGVMSELHRVTRTGKTIALEGAISTFSKLDPNLPWFNSETSADASDEDLEQVHVPDNLQPNHRRCEFYFDLQSHVFVFDSLTRKGGITARQMLKFLEQVFLHPDVTRSIDAVPRLTIIPDQKSVEEVLDWNRIRSLHIEAHVPNPGDYDEDDLREFEESLLEQNAKRLDVKLVAADNEYLRPSEKTQTLAGIAADNGFIEAKGEDAQGNIEVRSTKDKKPLVERSEFDPDVETAWDAFRRFSQSVVTEILQRRRSMRERQRSA